MSRGAGFAGCGKVFYNCRLMDPNQWAEFTSLPFWGRVGMCVLCGGVIGLERQLRGKPAGIRTCILICLGTMGFVYLGAQMNGPHADPTRVIGQIITGVGFLGAGVILTRQGLVKGVTSAAVVWVLAGIGSAVGLSRYGTAFALALVTVAILIIVDVLEHVFKRLRRGVHVHVVAPSTNGKPEEE